MDSVESGDVNSVVVKSVNRIARSIRDFDRTAERVKAAGAELHMIDEGLVLKPDEDDPLSERSLSFAWSVRSA